MNRTVKGEWVEVLNKLLKLLKEDEHYIWDCFGEHYITDFCYDKETDVISFLTNYIPGQP